MSPKPLYINKYLKLLLIFAITGAIVVACAAMETKSKESNSGPHTVAEWDQKYPQVFANAGYSGLIESSAQLKSLHNSPESQQELIGTITNPFGIRDDILMLTLSIPESTPQLRVAIIKYSQIINKMYYENINIEARLKLANQLSLSLTCARIAEGGYYWITQVNDMMRDTAERSLHLNKMDSTVFSWHVIGSGLSINEEIARCKNGSY